MAVLRIKYVNSYRDRHGRQRHYFRKGDVREPLIGLPGSAVFMEEYKRLLALHAPAVTQPRKAETGTLSWVIEQYKATSTRWAKAKPATRRAYERNFDYLDRHFGSAEFASFDESGVRSIRNKLRNTPSIADDVVGKIGMLWKFAKEHIDGMDRLGANPTAEVASIHTEHEAHKALPPELCGAIEKHPNPKVVRAYYLLRYTGQRRSDVVRMKASQFDGTGVELVQVKTGTYVWLPAHRALRDHLTATGIKGEYLLLRRGGKPMTGDYLGEIIREAVNELGYPGYSAHGLRHLAGAALAEVECTVHEIMSVLGHLTEKQAMEYVRQTNRKVLASNAMAKWGGRTASEQN